MSTLSDLHQASDDDSDESDDFSVGEEVLDPGAPLHVGAVHKGQQTCGQASRFERAGLVTHRLPEINQSAVSAVTFAP